MHQDMLQYMRHVVVDPISHDLDMRQYMRHVVIDAISHDLDMRQNMRHVVIYLMAIIDETLKLLEDETEH